MTHHEEATLKRLKTVEYELTYYNDSHTLAESPDNRLDRIVDSHEEAVELAKRYIESTASHLAPGVRIRKTGYGLYRLHPQLKFALIRIERGADCEDAVTIPITPDEYYLIREYNKPREFTRREVLREWHIGGPETTKQPA